MALKLPRFQAGRPLTEEVTADKLNQLVDAIRQCELNSGVGYDVARGPGGTTLTVKPGVMASAAPGATVILGMTNSGMSHTDATVVNPGTSSYGMQCKTPTGSYTTAFVHGVTFLVSELFNISTNPATVTTQIKPLAYDLNSTDFYEISASDTHRRVGLLNNDIEGFSYTENSLAYASQCAAITSGNYVAASGTTWFAIACNLATPYPLGAGAFDTSFTGNLYSTTVKAGQTGVNCSGTTYYSQGTCSGRAVRFYHTFSSLGTASGNYTRDLGSSRVDPGPALATGTFTYKRTFDASNVDASVVRIRCWVRIGQHDYNQANLVSLSSIRFNGQSVAYTYFDSYGDTNQKPEFIVYPIEFDAPLVDGTNTIEFNISNQNANAYPSVSFEFATTTVTITSVSGVDTGSFSDLTAAQQDLIGQGTPVKVKVTGVDKIYTYNGTGSKTSSGSYTYLRDA